MSLLHRMIIAFVVLTSVGGSCPALAVDHSKKGTAAYNLGHYTEAAQHFEAAYKVVQDPMMLFNLGQAYRLGGDSERALTAYRSYLRTAPEDAPNRERAERRVAELERASSFSFRGAEKPPTAIDVKPVTRPVVFQATAPSPVASEPFYHRWWFWTGAAAVAVGTVVGAVLLSGGRSTSCGSTVDFCAPVRP